MAEASVCTLDLDKAAYDAETDPILSHINVGAGTDVSILEVAQIIARVTGFTGEITCDTSKPDGTMRKLMDVTRLERMRWKAHISLKDGLTRTYAWYKDQLASGAVLRAN